jgi:mono/diheme cytochrome c family protein
MKSIRRVSLTVCLVAGFAVATIVPSMTAGAQAPAQGQTPEAGQARGGRGGNAGAAGARGGRGSVGTVAPPTSPVTGNAVEGKKLYFNYSCYSCHGYNGETEAGFIAFLRLRADRAPEQPATAMPNFPEKTLSDKQAKDIYAYIRTFKSNSPEVKDIPTLNAIVNAASKPYKP